MKIVHVAMISVLVLLALGASIATIFASQASSSRVHFESSLVGSSPNTPIDGVPSGGAPWVVTAGEAGITPSGRLVVSVVGLVLSIPGSPLDGTTGPVVSVLGSLVCQGRGGVVASTSPVPLASNGNAHINQIITLPSSCAGPIILIRIYATTSGVVASQPYIASTGFSS
jgi:hypothetical protein